jgi:hypothetical protein
MAKTQYQKERDALFKRIKRYNRSHGTNYKAEFPTYSELKKAGVSESDIEKIADSMRDVRGFKLVEQFTSGGPFVATSEHRVSSGEGAIYIKAEKGVGSKIGDILYINNGEQPYYVNEDTGQLIPNKTLFFASKFGVNVEEDYLTNTAINDRASGTVDPTITDEVYKQQIKEVEEKYPPTPTNNDEPDYTSGIDGGLWDSDWAYDDEDDEDELDEYGEGNNQAPDWHDFEDYEYPDRDNYTNEEYIDGVDNGHLGIDKNRKLKPKMSYDEIMQALDGDNYTPKEKDEFEKAFQYAEQSKANIEEILESYKGPKFVVINPGSHIGYYVNDEETVSKLKAILNESFSNNTNTAKGCYAWANYMDLMSSDLQTIIDSADSNYQDNDYADMLADIGTIMNNGRPLDPDVGMDLISEINTYDDYEEGW